MNRLEGAASSSASARLTPSFQTFTRPTNSQSRRDPGFFSDKFLQLVVPPEMQASTCRGYYAHIAGIDIVRDDASEIPRSRRQLRVPSGFRTARERKDVMSLFPSSSRVPRGPASTTSDVLSTTAAA